MEGKNSLIEFLANKKKELILLFAVLVICFFIIEIALRAIYPSQPVHKYGWYPGENHTIIELVHDREEVYRNVSITYYEHGFKRWGNASTNKTKVLILGDSFTEMKFVSNGEEYYSYLEKKFDNIELFVYGTGGYGTFQEFMVFNDYVDEIQPDIVVWQFFFNDYINDNYDFDRAEYPLNNHGYRPYLEDNKIVYRFPAPFGTLRKYSKITELIMNVYDSYLWEKLIENPNKKDLFYHKIYGEKFWERDFALAKIWDGNFLEAYNHTLNIFNMAKNRSNAKFFIFVVDDKLAKYDKLLCENANITCIPGVLEYLAKKENEGIRTTAVNDAHWNLEGNRLAGMFLVKYFNETGILS